MERRVEKFELREEWDGQSVTLDSRYKFGQTLQDSGYDWNIFNADVVFSPLEIWVKGANLIPVGLMGFNWADALVPEWAAKPLTAGNLNYISYFLFLN